MNRSGEIGNLAFTLKNIKNSFMRFVVGWFKFGWGDVVLNPKQRLLASHGKSQLGPCLNAFTNGSWPSCHGSQLDIFFTQL